MSSRIVKYRFNLTPNYKCFIRTRNGKYMETFKMLIYWRKFQRKINCPNFLYSEVWNIDTWNRMLTREKTWNWKIWYLFYLLSILKIFRNWTSFIFTFKIYLSLFFRWLQVFAPNKWFSEEFDIMIYVGNGSKVISVCNTRGYTFQL